MQLMFGGLGPEIFHERRRRRRWVGPTIYACCLLLSVSEMTTVINAFFRGPVAEYAKVESRRPQDGDEFLSFRNERLSLSPRDFSRLAEG